MNTTHGMNNSRLHVIWSGMKDRCQNKKSNKYNLYGGRGITMCQEWLDDFMNFYNWAMANGYADDLRIDRIDVNGNYEPSNCRWITNAEQQNNKRNNKMIEYKGETKTLAEWCRFLSLNYYTTYSRIFVLGWNAEEAFESPAKTH